MRKALALLLIFLTITLMQFATPPQRAQATTTDYVPVALVNETTYSVTGWDYCITNYTSLIQWYCGHDPKIITTNQLPLSQQWELVTRTNSRTQVNIRSVKSGTCMQYDSAAGAIDMVSCNFTKTEQCWDINYQTYPTSNPQIKPCSAMTKSIRPISASDPNGAGIEVDTTPPSYLSSFMWHIHPLETNNIEIKSLWSGKCMDVNNTGGGLQDGAKVQQWDCLGIAQTNQLFTLDALPDPAYRSAYWIKPQHSGKLICPTGDLGSAVKQCSTNVNVRFWYFIPIGGYFQIRSPSSSLFCMDLNNTYPSTQNGISVALWNCLSIYQDNQLWLLRKVIS